MQLTDFLDAISDYWFDVTNIILSLRDLQIKLLNPFNLNNNGYNLPMYNNDPDFQYFNDTYSTVLSNSEYFIEDLLTNIVDSYQ